MIESVIAKLLDPLSTVMLRVREYAIDESITEDPPTAGTKVIDMTGKRGPVSSYPHPRPPAIDPDL